MIKRLVTAAIAVVLTSAMPLSFTASASAATVAAINAPITLDQNTTYRYNYTIERLNGLGLPRSGKLELRFGADGIVSGRYTYDIGIPFIEVSGGYSGNDVWFDLGDSTTYLTHVTAKLESSGAIVGNADRDRSNAYYSFSAKPANS